jgi:DNA adenine methylase
MGGVEVVFLDCLSFLCHFLHLFHRWRGQFLDEYQKLVLAESESAVPHELKETFLTLRQAAESTEVETIINSEE